MSYQNKQRNTLAGGLVGLAALVGSAQHTDAAMIVNYTPNQIGLVSAPIVGLGETTSDYLLTNAFGTSTLDKNFNGNNQQIPGFSNPTTAKDAASFDNNYMFQLGSDGGIRKVNVSNGDQVFFNQLASLDPGAGAFGIGYDPVSNEIGIGRFDGNIMSFSSYNLGTGILTPLASFAFNTSAYGIPSGLDFKNGRMIVGTRDQFSMETEDFSNYILDMNANTGSIDQYATTPGSSSKLQDVLYSDGRLVTSYQSGGSGTIQVGDFPIVPEPATLMLLGAGGLALLRRKKEE